MLPIVKVVFNSKSIGSGSLPDQSWPKLKSNMTLQTPHKTASNFLANVREKLNASTSV